MERTLNIRDETCRYPGCCESLYTEFHHIQFWSNNGPTHPDNLVKLCRFNHRALHSGQFIIERRGSCDKPNCTQGKHHIDTLVFKTTKGVELKQNPKLPKGTTKDYFKQQWPNINKETATPDWYGETMDYSMAIEGLLWDRDHANN